MYNNKFIYTYEYTIDIDTCKILHRETLQQTLNTRNDVPKMDSQSMNKKQDKLIYLYIIIQRKKNV